jgi:hypothetical protein
MGIYKLNERRVTMSYCYQEGRRIFVKARFLIGIRWDGREIKFRSKDVQGEIQNPAQFCINRSWTKIEGVATDWSRFEVYKNPYPIVLGYGYRPAPDPGPTPDWELERRRKHSEYNSPEAVASRAAKKAAKEAEAKLAAEEYW